MEVDRGKGAEAPAVSPGDPLGEDSAPLQQTHLPFFLPCTRPLDTCCTTPAEA